jgi:hypothetical protein
LKNDPASLVRDVEDHIRNSPGLAICADLANGIKHLVINRNIRVDPDASVTRRELHLRLDEQLSGGTTEATMAVRYEIEAAGQTYDAYELARQCLDEWRTCLNQKKLNP